MSERGQAALEAIAGLPLLLAVALACGQLLAAGLCRELAAHAAAAGAAAILQDGDPARAARAAVPGWSRTRLDVRVRGRVVLVTLRPPAMLPGIAGRLAARSRADAGPQA
ncbi:MAG: hypothetical protein LT070_08375 [Solirubrobacteraceae bacterium]|nr:hypothetical protein [Solirubrobacteraceae bacterium]